MCFFMMFQRWSRIVRMYVARFICNLIFNECLADRKFSCTVHMYYLKKIEPELCISIYYILHDRTSS